jgi:hypothetical protein
MKKKFLQNIKYFYKKNYELRLPVFKLDLYQCINCRHAQILNIINRDIL